MASIESFISPDYVESYSEAHRRRPTRIDGPLCTMHVAIYYPANFAENFKGFMTTILNAIDYPSPQTISDKIYENLSPPSASTAKNTNPDFRASGDQIITKDHRTIRDGLWRVETHREYLTITLFAPFRISTSRKEEWVQIGIPSNGNCDHVQVHSSFKNNDKPEIRAAYQVEVTKFLITTSLNFMRTQFSDIFGALRVWSDNILIPDHKERRNSEPFVFAYFYGCAIPWTVYAPTLDKNDYPKFRSNFKNSADFNAQGPDSGNRFVNALWPALKPEFFPEARPPLPSGGHDSTSQSDEYAANFLQNGQSLYFSSLGSRISDNDESPLKYCIFYNDYFEKYDIDGNIINKEYQFETLSSTDSYDTEILFLLPNTNTTDKLALKASWRLSRLLGRIHDIGTVRLAALRNFTKMQTFVQSLREIEQTLQKIDKPQTQHAIHDVEVKLSRHADAVGEPVSYRSSRTRYYKLIHEELSSDLGIVELPEYQSYSQFVRRRLNSTMTFIGEIGSRYERVLNQIQNLYSAATAREILSIQRIADLVGCLIVIYYTMNASHAFTEYALNFILKIQPLLHGHQVEQLSHPDNWVDAVSQGIGALFGFCSYLAVAGRLEDSYNEIGNISGESSSSTHFRTQKKRGLRSAFVALLLAPYWIIREIWRCLILNSDSMLITTLSKKQKET